MTLTRKDLICDQMNGENRSLGQAELRAISILQSPCGNGKLTVFQTKYTATFWLWVVFKFSEDGRSRGLDEQLSIALLIAFTM